MSISHRLRPGYPRCQTRLRIQERKGEPMHKCLLHSMSWESDAPVLYQQSWKGTLTPLHGLPSRKLTIYFLDETAFRYLREREGHEFLIRARIFYNDDSRGVDISSRMQLREVDVPASLRISPEAWAVFTQCPGKNTYVVKDFP